MANYPKSNIDSIMDPQSNSDVSPLVSMLSHTTLAPDLGPDDLEMSESYLGSPSASALEPSTAALQVLSNRLEGHLFRGVDKFFNRYFKNTTWFKTIQDRLQDTESAKIMRILLADVPRIVHPNTLERWIANLQTLFSAVNNPSFGYHGELFGDAGGASKLSGYLESFHHPSFLGSTRVFGEVHGVDTITDEGDDWDDVLRFCERAQQVFKTQSARIFLHGFLVRGTTLELWMFDHSGAYSSKKLDLANSPERLVEVLAGYSFMSDHEVGFNACIKQWGPESDYYIDFPACGRVQLRTELIKAPENWIGPGTSCYAASILSALSELDTVVKFTWSNEDDAVHADLLELARERNMPGPVCLWARMDLVSIAHLRRGMDFPASFADRTFRCVAMTPLGRPICQYVSIPELLTVLYGTVRHLQSAYTKSKTLHHNIAIANLIIVPQPGTNEPGVVSLYPNTALNLDQVHRTGPAVGSHAFMAIDVLLGREHTYRHDLESLFYVFLWIAIANDRKHVEAKNILKGLPDTSRLRKWCSVDFMAAGKAKTNDMSPYGFGSILTEFSPDFIHLRLLAMELHTLLFPVRHGEIFTGTDMDEVATQRLYDGMAEAFNRYSVAYGGTSYEDCHDTERQFPSRSLVFRGKRA